MIPLETAYLEKCISSLEKAYSLLLKFSESSSEYELFRSASVKEFELVLEQSGNLLRKTLKHYFHSSKAVDALTFKDVFRHAVKHSILSVETCERWLTYRDNRNSTTHDYGFGFAEETLKLIPSIIADAKALVSSLNRINNEYSEQR
jgi:hypothetical protein